MPFFSTTLPNGLTLLGEQNPAALSVSTCFWVRTGARDETPEESGLSHFLEHMVFKGTEKRDPFAVNRDFSKIGADNNAWTSEENTVYYGTVLPEFLPQIVDVLADIMRPSLRVEDFETEKKVILDEIVRYEVQPQWGAYDHARSAYYGSHPLGNRVLGTTESVTALTQPQMRSYFDRRYGAGNILAVVTGQFDWPQYVDLIQKACSHWPTGSPGRNHRIEHRGRPEKYVLYKPADKVNQLYGTLITAAPAADSPLAYSAALLATAIGDYAGSRLFWALVDVGLAEEASMALDECDASGAYWISFSGSPENGEQNLSIVQKILDNVQKNGLTRDELEKTRTKILSREVRAGERSSRRMSVVAKDWVYRNQYRTVDDELKAWDAVSLDSIREVLDRYPINQPTICLYGPEV